MSVAIANDLVFQTLDERWIDQVHTIEQVSLPTPWSKELIASEFRKEYSLILGAAYGDVLLAYAISNLIFDELHILTLAVHPNYRSQGIGRSLLDEVILQSARQGARSAFLEVRKSNLPAQKLYEQAGFCFLGIRRGYYSDNGEDALLLKRLFSPEFTKYAKGNAQSDYPSD